MQSLQAKIFLLFVGVLIIVQSITLVTIYHAAEEQAQDSINTRLANATTIFKSIFQSNSEKLNAIAETAAKDGGLRENFYEDQRSFLVALNNHRKRIDADIVIAIDDKQIVKSQLIKIKNKFQKNKIIKGSEIDKKFRHLDWLLFPTKELLYQVNGEIFQMSIAPVNSGSENIGWIGFGFSIDKNIANNFERLTGLTTDFIVQDNGQSKLIARSTISKEKLDINYAEDISIRSDNNKIITEIIIGQVGSTQDKQLKVILHGSKDDLLDSIEKRWLQFLALAGFTLLLSLTGAYVISATITKPIKKLVSWTKFIANGNYSEPISISAKGEMGQLAKEFSMMQKEIILREQQILHRSSHHALTELPNRSKLIETLDELIKQESEPFLIHLINVSHINDINSSLGHEVGDKIINEFSSRLKLIPNNFRLFHIGADEFVLLTLKKSDELLTEGSELITQAFEQPYVDKSVSLNLRFKSGISIYPDHAKNAEELLQKAGTAMNHAKSTRTALKVYDSCQDIDTLEQLNLMNDLSTGIDKNQLVLYYQPKVTLQSNNTEAVEALVRWQHPGMGMIPPDKFISIAEKTGLINPLTDWVIKEALRQYSAWKQQGISLVIAVNISAENLKANDFYSKVCSMFEDENVPTEAIILEITESAVVDNPKEAINLLQRFRDKGFKLSIDDYGTGYSSLAQLKELPVDELKIDMSFVKRLPNDQDDKVIVHSTIELAHNMGLTVVAEGVESQAAMDWLRSKGCERAQGYHISRPVPASELESWLLHTPFYQRTFE